jgi:hypothetical protein
MMVTHHNLSFHAQRLADRDKSQTFFNSIFWLIFVIATSCEDAKGEGEDFLVLGMFNP